MKLIKKIKNSRNKNKTIWDITKLLREMLREKWIKNKQTIGETFNS
jgi:L-lactate utilization protein LutB